MSPTILWKGSFRFFFSLKDILSDEPPHIHIKRRTGSRDQMKVWLLSLEEDYCYGFSESERKAILEVIEQNQAKFFQAWTGRQKGIK